MNTALAHRRPDVPAPPSSGAGVDILPPQGASPAGDLQRQVCDAALRGFFAEPPQAWHYATLRHIAIATIAGGVGWTVVFGLGALLVR